MSVENSINSDDPNTPELYGWTLLAAANALEYASFIKYKLASDAGFTKLRDYKDIEECPTMIPVDTKNTHQSVTVDQPLLNLDPKQRSTSPFLSFWDFHEAYLAFETTPTKVAEALLGKLRESESLNYIRFLCNDIVEQAERSTLRYNSKSPLSQFDGIFISVKEELDIKGLETKSGTCFINDGRPASADSTVVEKLKKAGAIVVGSAVMNELGWDTFTVNPNTGVPKNPYKKALHSCGGSSGGSSGAVAAGLFPVSIGADGGGSVRIPSAFCGLYGLKTTWSRVSAHGGATLDPTVGCYGPLASTADDMTVAYSIISGPDSKDPYTLQQPPVSLNNYNNADLSDLTIAVVPEWNKATKEKAILQKLDQMQDFLRKQGAKIIEIDIPDLNIAKIAHRITICSEMSAFASQYSQNHKSFLPYTRIMYALNSALEIKDYLNSQRIRTKMINHIANCFHEKKIDLILTPTSAILSPDIPEKALSYGMSNAKITFRSMEYATLANFTGIPAVNVPAGFHGDLPVGLQFMASWWNEALLCRIAKTVETLSNFEKKRPEEHWFADNLL
ncbi:amidase signature domain-containing protein [Sporodiniella umbellata]|nr:amidase signature domain-containing protein [Sporodiniella umbellata]